MHWYFSTIAAVIHPWEICAYICITGRSLQASHAWISEDIKCRSFFAGQFPIGQESTGLGGRKARDRDRCSAKWTRVFCYVFALGGCWGKLVERGNIKAFGQKSRLSWKVVGHHSGYQSHHLREFKGTFGLYLIRKSDKMIIYWLHLPLINIKLIPLPLLNTSV